MLTLDADPTGRQLAYYVSRPQLFSYKSIFLTTVVNAVFFFFFFCMKMCLVNN